MSSLSYLLIFHELIRIFFFFFCSTILSDCARIEITLATEALDHEMQVEQLVVTPLQQMLDNDVAKCKAKLSKLTLDLDSAKTRYLLLTFENCDKTIFFFFQERL